MITDQIKEMMQVEPFQPIRIVLGDNQSFVVNHTDYLIVSPDRMTVTFYDDRGQFKFLIAQQIRFVEPISRRPSKKRS